MRERSPLHETGPTEWPPANSVVAAAAGNDRIRNRYGRDLVVSVFIFKLNTLV